MDYNLLCKCFDYAHFTRQYYHLSMQTNLAPAIEWLSYYPTNKTYAKYYEDIPKVLKTITNKHGL